MARSGGVSAQPSATQGCPASLLCPAGSTFTVGCVLLALFPAAVISHQAAVASQPTAPTGCPRATFTWRFPAGLWATAASTAQRAAILCPRPIQPGVSVTSPAPPSSSAAAPPTPHPPTHMTARAGGGGAALAGPRRAHTPPPTPAPTHPTPPPPSPPPPPSGSSPTQPLPGCCKPCWARSPTAHLLNESPSTRRCLLHRRRYLSSPTPFLCPAMCSFLQVHQPIIPPARPRLM